MKSINGYFYGKGVVQGISIGRAYVIATQDNESVRSHIESYDLEHEKQRFKIAVEKSYDHLEKIKNKLDAEHSDPGHIIGAQQLMLKDAELYDSVTKIISDDLVNTEWALEKSLDKWRSLFGQVEDEYIRERFTDIKHLFTIITRHLRGVDCDIFNPPPDAIVVASELSSAETIQLGKNAVSALVLEKGGRTSHTVIIAKAFEIPTLVGIKNIRESVGTGDLLIVDGNEGIIITNPDVSLIQEYRHKMHKIYAREQNLILESSLPAITVDNHTINIFANIDFSDEISQANSHGAEGIGLYRTEFLFISNFNAAEDEELHFNDTKKIMGKMGSGSFTIRTFDLGSDKIPLGKEFDEESNPALGLRSLRLALKVRSILKKQIRGILRAYVYYPDINLRIMFPLVGSFDEFMEAKEVFYEALTELTNEGHEIPDDIEIGTMMELPSACMISDILATECDFFSIGSNDLTQYALAVDRSSDNVSYLYNSLNPGVLRLIKFVIENSAKANIPVSLCGDMATEPISALVLIGLGLTSLSMPPVFIPHIKELIRSVKYEDIVKFTNIALTMKSHKDIEELFRKEFESFLVEESVLSDNDS